MLQRAASNAYSWWWASHIRTKQSKWLEQSLQDMGERVETVMKLIQEDGDTFARRAEMYYKKRPELISFVEESFRAYQSLAERYDHLSKELQNANSTLASAFPDQFQYPMDEDFDDPPPRGFKKFQEKPNPNIPKAPSKFPAKNLKVFMALTANKNNDDPIKKAQKTASNAKKSDLTKDEAVNEIDKLQKQILTLQTEKEFAKSSYEKGYSKYWDIEEQIPTLQERISKLQDEFGITQAIKDEEARTLMAEAALKSCQQTLAQLLERQAKAVAEAKAERLRIREAREKLKSLKGEVLHAHEDQIEESEKGYSRESGENLMSFNDEVDDSMDSKELEKIRDKIKEHFDVGPTGSLTVTEMAEKIDELVNKVISLESSVSSQNAKTHRLRSETDELNSQINTLENDKSTLTEGKDTLNDQLASMEKKLKDLQDLNRDFEKENRKLETHFTEARSNLDTMSEKLHDVKPDEEVSYLSAIKEMKKKEKKEKKERKKEKREKKEKKKMEKEKEKKRSDKIKSDASSPSEMEPDELESYGLRLSTTTSPTTKEPNELHSSIPSKKESAEIYSTASTPEEDDTQVKKQPSDDDEPKQIGSDVVAQSLASANKQDVDPVKTREPENMSKDDERKLSGSEEVEPIKVKESESAPKDEIALAKEVKPKEPVSEPTDESNAVQTSKEEDETDWRQLFMDTKEEYSSTLINYKEAKKKLGEMEQKTQDDISLIMKQLKELKNSNAKKDEELYNMRQKIIALQKRLEEYKSLKEANDAEPRVKNEEPLSPDEDDFDIKVISADDSHQISPLEEKLRADIDEILEENLDFWMRFSSSFAQVQKFQNTIKDLRAELEKLEGYDERKEGSSHGGSSHGGSSRGSIHINPAMKSDAKPIYKHLREIQTELTVWMEQSEKLKDELQSRFTQLCNIEHDIKRALNAGAEDEDMKFTSFQAAKFQGEVANMQQENHKVADELQAGMDHITILQLELKRTVLRLDDELGFSGTQAYQDDSVSRSRNQNQVPLRSFIFGVKPQKKKQSIFSLMHPAMINKRSQHLKSDKSM